MVTSEERKKKVRLSILLCGLLLASFFSFCFQKKETIEADKVPIESKNDQPQKEMSGSLIKKDSLKVWNKIAEDRTMIEDSIFYTNECNPSLDTTNCFKARAYRDSLNVLDRWYIDNWECVQNGRKPIYTNLMSEGHDEGRASIYKRLIEQLGFVAIWDFNYKLYILKRKKI